MQDLPELSVKHLRALVVLGRAGKFTAAAAELGVSQPGLSRIIQQAEDLLGVTLFERGTRRVAQTEAGRHFLPAAERMLDDLVQQVRNIREKDGELRGQLVISSLMSISRHVLPAALVAFRKLYPKMHIRVREGLQSGIEEDIRSGHADFGIGTPPASRRGINVLSVIEERCFAILPRDHRLAGRSVIALRDLQGEVFISMPPDSGLRRLIDGAASAQSVGLEHGIVINQYQSLFEFVSSGLGVSIVPASALPPMREPSLLICTIKPLIRRRIGVLHHAERPLSAASDEFLKIFRPMFQAAARRS